MAGAKGKVIERYTHLSHRRVRTLYQVLRGIAPPAGPVMQGNARYFAIPSKYTSTAWSVQCAIFLACYERMNNITAVPVQRGWLLLATFNSYLTLTEKLHETTAVKRLDINQAYALLSYCGFMTAPNGAELMRTQCPVCLINYPVVVKETVDSQPCPLCTMNANCQRLANRDWPSESTDNIPETQ